MKACIRVRRRTRLLPTTAWGGQVKPKADKAFDLNIIIEDLDARGSKVIISQHPRRAKPLAINKETYKWRHLIENFFCKLKEFKRIAMRAVPIR